MRIQILMAALALSVLGTLAVVGAQDRHREGDLHGQVRFPTTCEPEVQARFERAVAVLHSFGYDEARRGFLEVAEEDPACGMAWWGVAMTYFHQHWDQPTADELAAGREAAEKAAEVGADSERERAYIEAMRLAAAGWLAYAEDRMEEAVQLLTAAAEKEDAVGKHPVTPGPILPAREMLADVLLELGRPQGALAAYEATLTDSPNRFNSLAGAGQAAERSGRREQARAHYEALLDLCSPPVCPRPAAQRAARFLNGR